MPPKKKYRTKLQSGPFRPAHQVVKSAEQLGGFPLAPLIAGASALYTGLTKYQPFTKANKAQHENVPEKKKGNLAYKITDKITGVGKSLGIGATLQPMYQGYPVATGAQFQPTAKMKRKRNKK